MPVSLRVNDKYVAKCAPVACGSCKQFAFDVVDNDTVFPSKKLAHR